MNKLKKLVFKEKGSVSIFAILIILPIFMLNALLIDTIRIISAERQLENAMEAALRSTAATFNTELANIGLFAYGGEEEVKEYFEGYLKNQFLSPDQLSGTYNLSMPSITNVSVSYPDNRNLVDYDVFTHQILESIKYQAPVQLGKDFTELIFGGKGVSQDEIDDAQELVENYEEIIELAKKRNEQIDKALKYLNPYLDVTKDIEKMIGSEKSDSNKKIENEIKTFQEFVFYYERYKELLEKKNDDELTKDEKEEMKTFKNSRRKILDTISTTLLEVDLYHGEIPVYLIGSGGSIDRPKSGSAKYYNDKINELMGEGDNELLKDLERIKLEDKFFEDIVNGVNEIYEEVIEKTPPTTSIWEITNPGNSSIGILFTYFNSLMHTDDLDRASRVNHLSKMVINSIKNRLEKLNKDPIKPIRDNHLKKYESVKKVLENPETKKEEEAADQSFADLWLELNQFADVVNQISGDSQTYAELDRIIQELNGVTGGSADFDEPSRLQFIKDAFARFKEFVQFMQGFPESVQTELYINEYILANYGTTKPYELINPKSYAYNTKQAQYITYGYNEPGMNYAMFIKDVALILFVSHLLSQTIQGGFAGPLGFFKAISGALLSTIDDIINLTTGPEYQTYWNPFKGFGINIGKRGQGILITMPMFMRLIMAMKSTGDTYNKEKMRRLQAVITKETGEDLKTSHTYIEGSVEGEVKLWFLPQLAKVLPGEVEGNRYVIKKRKVFSY